MNLDFIKPNASTVGWIDSYFQFHDEARVRRAAEEVADRNYDRNYDGWYEQPEDVIKAAFYDFLAAMTRLGITQEEIENQ